MVEFKMPSLGAEMAAGTLLEWKIKPGDHVKRGDIVAVVDTEKAAIEVEIWLEGIVSKLLAEPGQKVPVGAPLAILEVQDSQATERELSQKQIPQRLIQEASQERKKISPLARKRAEDLGVDLASVQGSGAGGAVTEYDVERAAPSYTESERNAGMKRAIAAAMSRSKREIPHYYLISTISLSSALAWLEEENSKRDILQRILLAALLVKAVAKASMDYPEFNGFWRNDRFEPASSVNVGMAISLHKQGLIAPALLGAEKLSLDQVMEKLRDLVERARAGTLRGSEISDASITLTNLGDLGVDQVLGIIYPPQVALIGFGKPSSSGSVTASLSGDHRVSDGARGSLFLTRLGRLLSDPECLRKGT